MHITLTIHKLETSKEFKHIWQQVIDHYQEIAYAVGQGHEFNVQKYNLESHIKKMEGLENSLAHLRQHAEQLKEMGFEHEGKKLQADIKNYWSAIVRSLRTFEAFASGVTNANYVLRRLTAEQNSRQEDIDKGRILGSYQKECIEKMEVHLRHQRDMLCYWETND